MTVRERSAPEALLLVAPGCPHCPGMLDRLGARVKDGRLARLEVVNIAARPESAAALGVRTVPWARIGPFELAGTLGDRELDEWIEAAGNDTGWAKYLEHLLAHRQLARVEDMVRKQPEHLNAIVELLGDPHSGIQVRLGAGAVLEGMEGEPVLAALAPPLARLTRHEDPRIRADACHFLALTHHAGARPELEACLNDPDPEVREIAAESLHLLAGD